MKLLVPVRYPLTDASRRTLERAVEVKEESDEDADIVVLHVNLIQKGDDTSREELMREVENEFDLNADYVVRTGFLIEEKILEEVGREEIDMVLIGRNRSGRLRRAFDRLVDNNPDIETFLRGNLDITIEVVD